MRATFAAAAVSLAALSATPLAAQQDDRWQITLDQDRYVWDVRLVKLDGDSLVVRQAEPTDRLDRGGIGRPVWQGFASPYEPGATRTRDLLLPKGVPACLDHAWSASHLRLGLSQAIDKSTPGESRGRNAMGPRFLRDAPD
jgi:hypothetical protein